MEVTEACSLDTAIDDICRLKWSRLGESDLVGVAWAYYYFSVQFRENLEIARSLHPDDPMLRQLEKEECDTSNLSPWPGVADAGERMNHDEFMLRLLKLSPIDESRRMALDEIGQSYLDATRSVSLAARALSIASYEDGGLERLFKAILQASHWDNPLLQAFRHFLTEHIRFDSDPDGGHGALSRHLAPDDRVLPLWDAARRLFVEAVPSLA